MIPGLKAEFLHRLKRASAREIAYRLRKKLTVRKIKASLAQGRAPFSVPSVDPGQSASLEMPEIKVTSMGGFNEHHEQITRFEDKHRNTFFDAIRIDPDGPDIRAVWEPARLQHAALLLHDSSSDMAGRQAGKEAVLKWIRNNPFLRGPHYISAMECGLRAPVFFYCLKAGIDLSNDEREILLRALYEHAWWIERNLSLYASLGNHTVCECVGLVFSGAVFRNTQEGRKWLETGCRLLHQELTHQVLADGGPAEQSFSYHRFVLDLYWLAADFLEKNRLHDCTEWKAHLLRGESFLLAFQGKGRSLPSIGDSDDGHAVAPGAAPLRGKAEIPEDAVTTFPDSGYTVVRGYGRGLALTFAHGPLGMPPLYNHGHADALSITLSSDDKPILVDPGTYRYNWVPEWRRYFKGTRAHNTVRVDGQDQAVQETGFIWGKPYRASLRNVKGENGWVLLRGSHDGYKRLNGGVIHERSLFIENDSRVLIKDSFKGKGIHEFELNFHLHPDAVVEEADAWTKVNIAGATAFIRLVDGGSFEVIRGREAPIHGWYSPAYGVKIPSPVLSCRTHKQASEALFVSVISLNDACDVIGLKKRFVQIEQQAFHS